MLSALQARASASPARRRYRCTDGHLRVLCETEEQWRALVKCLGRPEFGYTGAWAIITATAPRGPLGRVLESIFFEDSVANWLRRLQSRGVPCSQA